ncbi:MAG: hypothetical protein KA052_03125 [Candidatus Pacebacteria bacterium]|nr:hypothetical protein [Candidatus Paceibacterota bacterium]
MAHISLKNNAYHILGLDTSASEKELLKRSKEIINRIKIDDTPEYDLDLGMFEDFRTEDSVKEALQKLQAPKKRIREYFFWFQISDNVDEQALGLLKHKDYLNAIRTWQNAADGDGAKSYFYRKNLAILYCMVLSVENDKQYLQDSLTIWKSILDSDKFWSAFSKAYKLHDEQTASDEVISEFKKHVASYLSDIYTELHELHNDNDYIQQFQSVFSAKGEQVEKKILNPVYQTIHGAVEKLEKLKVSEDGKLDKEESDGIRNAVGVIQAEMNKLIDLGLYDDSQTKIMRDRAANALRAIVLDLHNNLSELDKSAKLLEVAISIVGTDSLKNKLSAELEQISKNVTDDAENSLAIEVPGTFGGGTVLFKNSYLEYNNKRIFYKDATAVSYHAMNQSINFIPISQSFSFMVASEKEKISFSFGTTLHIGKKAKQDVWGKLIGLSGGLIEPHIVKRYVDQIFDRGEPIKIGNVEFSKEGYSKTRTKLFGGKETETVLWTDTIYIPKFDSGQVVLWKDKGGSGVLFEQIAMSVDNAVVLPELVQACINRA